MSSRNGLSIDIKTAAGVNVPNASPRHLLPAPPHSDSGNGSGAVVPPPSASALSRSTSAASSDEPLTPTPLLPNDLKPSDSARPLRPTLPAGPAPPHSAITSSPLVSPATPPDGQPHFVDIPPDPLGGGGGAVYYNAEAISAAAAAGALDYNPPPARIPMQLDGADCCGCVSNPRSASLDLSCCSIRMCQCWTALPFEFRVLLIQIVALGICVLGITLAVLFEITSLAVVAVVLSVFIILTIIVHRVMIRARTYHRNQRYHALPQQQQQQTGAAYRAGAGLHPLALRHLQSPAHPTHSAFAASAAAATGAGHSALYEDLLASTISQNAYALDPETLAQLALVNPRLGRQISGSTHMRLSMMDREFTPNDYETLCSLDEESARRSGPVTGIPQSQIERMPIVVVQPKTATATATAAVATTAAATAAPTAAVSTSSGIVIAPAVPTIATGAAAETATAAASPVVEAHKCAICLEPTQPGDALRVLLCMHRFHVDCVDRWLRRKAVCPTCKFDHKKL